ncbi:MAG: phosphatase PAP2 family protein [Methylobacteriaceae bacterium]|nr:phosphatase PAP2 family protein [Methylobacteriaceae bacterium]
MGASPSHHVGDGRRCPYRHAETRLLVQSCVAAALALIATAIWPEIDLATARLMILAPESPLRPFASILREAGRGAPLLLCAGLVAGFLTSAMRVPEQRGAKIRRAVYVVSVLAIGSGLLVNAGLKNYSHRPRPLHTSEVAGAAAPFRPFYRFDGACRTNCSFASGEAASAFWTSAPALLAPPGVRLVAVSAALGFGLAVSVLRMMLGAHFLSDVAFSALAILLLTLGARRLLKID